MLDRLVLRPEQQIAGIKCLFQPAGLAALIQHKQLRPDRPAATHPLAPKVHRALIAHITAEAIHCQLPYTPFHVPPQVLPQRGVIKIQQREAPFAVIHIPLRGAAHKVRVLRQKHRLRPAVQIHQIQQHPQAQPVRRVHKALQIVRGAVFRVNGKVILDAIGVARLAIPAVPLAL